MKTRRSRLSLSSLAERAHLILSVDDDSSVLYGRYKILQQAGYEVLNAVEGKHALQLFTAFPVDLVLLDYLMPGPNGTVIAEEMKRRRQNVPIILITAFLPDEGMTFVDGFVEKGNGPLPLLAAIRGQIGYPARERRSAA